MLCSTTAVCSAWSWAGSCAWILVHRVVVEVANQPALETTPCCCNTAAVRSAWSWASFVHTGSWAGFCAWILAPLAVDVAGLSQNQHVLETGPSCCGSAAVSMLGRGGCAHAWWLAI